MYEFVKLLKTFGIVLQNCKTIAVNVECAVIKFAHKTDAIIPLAFIFYEFNILR